MVLPSGKLALMMSTNDGEHRHDLLLVEDDQKLAALIAEYLVQNRFNVEISSCGENAIDRIRNAPPSCVILDVVLPGADGFEVCRRVRPQYNGPILMLTARGDDVDEVLGLGVGADDYLAKPVAPRKLLARIHAHLRRCERLTTPCEDVIHVGDLSVCNSSRTATLAGQPIELSTAEFDLLLLLAAHAGQTLSRATLHHQLRGLKYDGLDRSIDITVTRLRKKLRDDATRPRYIKSVRGVGYMLAESKV